MNNFIVVYDEEIEDRGRDSYLKAIKKNIPEAIIADVDNLPDCTVRNVLALKPMADDTYKWIMELLLYVRMSIFLFNTLKYLFRFGNKDDLKDLYKASDYLERLIAAYEEKGEKENVWKIK